MRHVFYPNHPEMIFPFIIFDICNIAVSYTHLPSENNGSGENSQDVCEFIWFQFDMSASQNFLGLTAPYSEYLFRRLLNYKHRTKKANTKDLQVLNRAFHLLGSKEISQQILGYSFFLQFVANNICTADIELRCV